MGSLLDKLWSITRHAELSTHCLRRGCAAYLWPADALRINGGLHCTGEKQACGCQHAEARLIVEVLVLRTSGPHKLLITSSPCVNCAYIILESQLITQVYYLRESSDTRGINLLRLAGIEARKAVETDEL